MIDIEKIEKRTVRSFYDDGLFEISLGLVFLLLGGYFFAQSSVPEGSTVHSWLSAAFVLLIVSAGLLVNSVLRFLKRRVAYPRTGYVAFKEKRVGGKRRFATALVGALMGGSIAALYQIAPSAKTLLPALNGLLLAFVALVLAHRIGLARVYILAAASAVTGFAITAAGIGDIKGLSLYYGLFGAALVLSGLAALIVYLRRSPLPADDAAEGPDAG